VVIDGDARTWRVLDAARARSPNTRAHWQPAAADDATGRAFIARDVRTGRKLVRVLDRHPADP
jgi:hypothetical protein